MTADDPTALWINDRVAIPRGELEMKASRAGGPGGQHVNTSSTRIEITWNVRESAALGADERERVLAALANRVSAEGTVRVVSSEARSQRQNRDAAERRLAELIRRALVVQKKRRKTKPSRASKEKRLDGKRRRSETKRERRQPDHD
ncbi:MAG: alternative ribosome rescue aminoacyl-tRNA hydrolase ArfB [Gemmatimonadaceae bacterium]